MDIIIDIETIPDTRENVRDYFRAKVKHPAQMKKAETIAEWEKNERPTAEDDAIRKLAVDPWFARPIVACVLPEDDEIVTFVEDGTGERALLCRVFAYLKELRKYKGFDAGTRFIGHNVLFDLRVLEARSVVNGIRSSVNLPYDAKPWSDRILDTSTYLGDARDMVSMDKMCLALGIDGKGDFSGADVYDAYLAGEITKIAEYCAADVRRTAQLAARMSSREVV